MTLEDYLVAVDSKLRYLDSLILSFTIQREIDTNLRRGFIKGQIEFVDGSRLHFSEQIPIERRKYRLHYMDSQDRLIARWDSAPHHKRLDTYPFHKHTPDGVEAHSAVTLVTVLDRIAQLIEI